jgi:peptide subunit release factor RF-3
MTTDQARDCDSKSPTDFLTHLAPIELIRLRAALDVEMKRRKVAISVGQMAEELVIQLFNRTSGYPNLLAAPVGTANVDALSRRGERYSIKGICNAKKTGTIYPDRDNPNKQLFEYLLIVKMTRDWSLDAVYEFDWKAFCECRSWDKRMNAW